MAIRSSAMLVLLVCAILFSTTTEGAIDINAVRRRRPPPPPKLTPKKVRCGNRIMFPYCSKQPTCPPACPRVCFVDCYSCKPVCCQSSEDSNLDRLMITFDGEEVELPAEEGAKWESLAEPAVTISRLSEANVVTLEVDGVLKVTATVVPITEESSRVHGYGITADDCFAHLELAFSLYSLTEDVDGVLGQTYGKNYVSRVKLASKMPLMGGERKFSSSGLYATDCAVARFKQGGSSMTMPAELGEVKCASDASGRGIACK
ncbi:hypothetical protein J5N97_012220 [Dioscorea zingiberensis]|uniref:Uncharacterized protein n=1 Tax=Dioscorea zingiberensis TaxID=325984 RepID=A0A9D5CNK4_9LILI|nr:hypothetical protein J5N97_012220 [Dioscorea zingiberensis]